MGGTLIVGDGAVGAIGAQAVGEPRGDGAGGALTDSVGTGALTDGDRVAGGFHIQFACSLGERLFGLLRKGVCAHGEVLALLPCRSVHSFGMREAIDVAFIDRQGLVLKVARALPPRRILSCGRAIGTLERRTVQGTLWFRPGETVGLAVGPTERIEGTEGRAR